MRSVLAVQSLAVAAVHPGVVHVAKPAELLTSGASTSADDGASGGTFGPGPSGSGGGAPPSDAALDLELLALPAPPGGRRLIAASLMFATIAAALGLLGALRTDLGYFFSEGRAIDLGEAMAVPVGTLASNTFVRVRGTPMASGTVRYQRVIGAETYTIFPLAGQRAIFVSMPTESLGDEARMARREWSGRLVTFGQLGGRLAGVQSYLRNRVRMPVTRESYVLLVDEPPGSYGWALLLAGLCVVFVAVNLGLIVRWFRPVRRSAGAAP